MPELEILAWLSPAIFLIAMVGTVAIIAIYRADTKDIPTIVVEVMSAFRRIAETLPGPDGERDPQRSIDSKRPNGNSSEEPGELLDERTDEVSDEAP